MVVVVVQVGSGRRVVVRLGALAGSMGGPVEFETALDALDRDAVQVVVDVLGDLVAWKFNEAVANGRVLDLISDEFDVGNRSDLIQSMRQL